MKMLIFLSVVVSVGSSSQFAGKSPANEVKPSVAADKTVKTSVTGAGDSKYKAESEAEKAARSISFGYRVVSKNTSGSGKNYVCTMIIEYTPKN